MYGRINVLKFLVLLFWTGAIFSLETGAIQTYFDQFQTLATNENWDTIHTLALPALDEASKTNQRQETAKIYAQLTSSAFYQGKYEEALRYAQRCHELSQEFTEPDLLIRALYLESAIYRAFANKNIDKTAQQEDYAKAVQIATEASKWYEKSNLDHLGLKGKVYFNLGAAHADNPEGNLGEATRCYSVAMECFDHIGSSADMIRTQIRLGKIYLLQKNYSAVQSTLDILRPQINSQRIAMHADYLEAQLQLAVQNFQEAKELIQNGLNLANSLGAEADKERFEILQQQLEELL